MKAEGRRQGILDLLMEAGAATVEEMSAHFDVSRMTIHRDLDQLEQEGLLRKVRGGASVQSSGQFESDFRYRQRLAGPEKQRIAAAAASLVEPGQTIIVDDSSTAGGIAAHLADIRPLTVITNNLGVIQELSGAAGVTLIALGGQYSKKFHGFFGLVTDEALRSLRADVAFVSTSSIHGVRAFHQDQEVMQTKRLMLAAAERTYLLADHGKFGRPALHFFAALDRFDAILTGEEPPAPMRKALHEAGIRLTVTGKA